MKHARKMLIGRIKSTLIFKVKNDDTELLSTKIKESLEKYDKFGLNYSVRFLLAFFVEHFI